MINISSQEFRVWQHLEDHWNGTQFTTWSTCCQFLLINSTNTWPAVTDLSIPIMSTDESTGDTVSVWTLFSHTGIYIMAIGSLIPAGLGICCCYFFWCQPARLVWQPLQSDSM